jgi:thiamine-phosphate pyrophosphorylase
VHMTNQIVGLYAITPDGLAAAQLMELVDAAIAGGAQLVQYRDKNASHSQLAERAAALQALCRGRGVPMIINDHVQLALAIGADGVHLGRDDGAVSQARAALGARALIGVSCYASTASARQAQQDGCDYVAFGSVFASPTKPAAPPVLLAVFKEARALGVTLPLVGIGGITDHNLDALIAAGADSAAVINQLFGTLKRDSVFASARRLSHFFSKL